MGKGLQNLLWIPFQKHSHILHLKDRKSTLIKLSNSVRHAAHHFHRRAIAQHFGAGALAEVGAIVADADDRICPELLRMGHHLVKGVLTGGFAHVGESPDIPSDDALQPAKDVLPDGGRAHNDASDDAEFFRDFVSCEGEGRGGKHGIYEVMRLEAIPKPPS